MNKITFFALMAFLVACSPKTPHYTGKFKIDAETEYVALNHSSSIGGACEGWSALEIRKTGASSGLDNVVCWMRDGENIAITGQDGSQKTSGPSSMWID